MPTDFLSAVTAWLSLTLVPCSRAQPCLTCRERELHFGGLVVLEFPLCLRCPSLLGDPPVPSAAVLSGPLASWFSDVSWLRVRPPRRRADVPWSPLGLLPRGAFPLCTKRKGLSSQSPSHWPVSALKHERKISDITFWWQAAPVSFMGFQTP